MTVDAARGESLPADATTGPLGPRLEGLFGPRPYAKPAPAAGAPPKRTVWVVQQISGGRLRVLAEWHSSAPQQEGAELRFYDGTGEARRRVATVRAGSWHWCVEESSLDPKGAES